MKKEQVKGFVAGILVMGLCVGLIGTATAEKRQIFGDFLGTRLQINNEFIEPKDINGNPVELFAVNGTTYLPVRCVAEALGLEAGWDDIHNIVFVNAPARSLQSALSYEYQDTNVPRFENIVGNNAFYDIAVKSKMEITYMYRVDHFGSQAKSDYYSQYADMLKNRGFKLGTTSTEAGNVSMTLKNDETHTTVSLVTYLDQRQSKCVSITVDTSKVKADSTTNNSANEGSTGDNGGATNKKYTYYSDAAWCPDFGVAFGIKPDYYDNDGKSAMRYYAIASFDYIEKYIEVLEDDGFVFSPEISDGLDGTAPMAYVKDFALGQVVSIDIDHTNRLEIFYLIP